MVLIDIGASAGLNLLLDRYTYDYSNHVSVAGEDSVVLECEIRTGLPFPDLSRPLAVGHRAGIDLNPLDPENPEDVRWLRACVWPEHTDRLRLLDGALTLATNDPPDVYQGDVLDLLHEVVDGAPGDLSGLCLPLGHPRLLPRGCPAPLHRATRGRRLTTAPLLGFPGGR